MDSHNEFDNIKAEKAKAMKNYQRKLKLKTFLYFLELCIVLALIPSLYNSIPIVKDYVKSLVIRLFHKTFYVFLLTNVMVFALAISFYVKSECNEGKESVYDEYVHVIESRQEFTASEPEIVDDKAVIYCDNNQNNVVDEVKHESVVAIVKEDKVLRRSVTGLGRELEAVKRKRELRRSETDKCRSAVVEDMSSEEFKSTIERFIAMQKMTQLEELKKEGIVLSQNAQPRAMALSH